MSSDGRTCIRAVLTGALMAVLMAATIQALDYVKMRNAMHNRMNIYTATQNVNR